MKYILEIKPEYEANGIMILGARNSHLYVTTLEVKDLEELNSDYINEHFGWLQDDAYQRGFDDAHRISEEEYHRGLEDGKALSGRSCEGCVYQDKTIEHHPCDYCRNAYLNQWQAKTDDEIKVGDEVKWEGVNFTVLRVFTPKGCYEQCDGFDCDGNGYTNILTKDVTKTNRHFDIQKILEEMKG